MNYGINARLLMLLASLFFIFSSIVAGNEWKSYPVKLMGGTFIISEDDTYSDNDQNWYSKSLTLYDTTLINPLNRLVQKGRIVNVRLKITYREINDGYQHVFIQLGQESGSPARYSTMLEHGGSGLNGNYKTYYLGSNLNSSNNALTNATAAEPGIATKPWNGEFNAITLMFGAKGKNSDDWEINELCIEYQEEDLQPPLIENYTCKIQTLKDLFWLTTTSVRVDPYFNSVLFLNDIDASYTKNWYGGKGFDPINSGDRGYNKTIKGNNVIITGLTINRPDLDKVGLFGHAGGDYFNCSDLNLHDINIIGKSSVGALVGYVSTEISAHVENCRVTGNIMGTNYVGALIGYPYEVISIVDCHTNADVSGVDCIGGLSGRLAGVKSFWTSTKCQVKNCSSVGSCSGTGDYVGGLAGSIYYTDIENCYVHGVVSSNGSYVGGLVGACKTSSIKYAYSVASVTGGVSDFGGLVGYTNSSDIVSAYFVDSNKDNGIGKTLPIQEFSSDINFEGWNFNTLWYIVKVDQLYPGYALPYFQWQIQDRLHPVSFSVTNKEGISVKDAKVTIIAPYREIVANEQGDFLLNLPNGSYSFYAEGPYPYLKGEVQTFTVEDGSVSRTMVLEALVQQPPLNSEGVYEISTLAQLRWLSEGGPAEDKLSPDRLQAHYQLMNDLDATETKQWHVNEEGMAQGFNPIGKNYNEEFSGTFDGGGHCIKGLFINRPTTSYIGFFGHISESGKVFNLGLKEVEINGHNYVAALAGSSDGVISSVFATGELTGKIYCGGLAGYNNTHAMISNCYANMQVMVKDNEYTYAGGLVGFNSGIAQNCYVLGNITSVNPASEVFGVIGYNSGRGEQLYYLEGENTDKHATALTLSQMSDSERFLQWDFKSTWIMDQVNDIYPGYVVPHLIPFSNIQTHQVQFTVRNTEGTMLKDATIRVGDQEFTTNSQGVASVLLPDGEHSYFIFAAGYKKSESIFAMVNGAALQLNVEMEKIEYAGGEGTAENPYRIETLEQLRRLSEVESDWGKSYIQVADIDALETEQWNNYKGFSPIGHSEHPFTGTYNGGGFAISNLFIKRTFLNDAGLFGRTGEGAWVKNVTLENARVNGGDNTSALVGCSNGDSIVNCMVSGNVRGNQNVGLLAGSSNSIVKACSTSGYVSGSYAGGLIGLLEGTGRVDKCYSEADAFGHYDAGGLIGECNGGIISASFTAGVVRGYGNVGGLTGRLSNAIILNSYSTSKLDVYNSSYGSNTAGGITGSSYDGKIENCYATGIISSTAEEPKLGGVVGYYTGTLINNTYWDTERTGQLVLASNDNTSSNTGDWFSVQDNFTGWAFGGADDAEWVMGQDDESIHRPILKWTAFNITYHLDGGDNVTGNPNYFTGRSAVLLKDPVKAGCVFTGWYSDGAYLNKVETIEQGTSQNVELWASFDNIPTLTNDPSDDPALLKVYPNPASDHIILEMPEVNDVEIYQLTGRPIRRIKVTGPKVKIQVGDLPAGVYLLRVGHSSAKFEIVK